MPTLEEASKCPRCGEPGEKQGERPSGNPGNKVLVYRCKNTTCPWGSDPDDMGWLIEMDPKGNIPQRQKNDKQFPKVSPPPGVIEQAQRVGEQLSRPVKNLDNTPEVGY